ncbi:MAG: hypothetical protein FWG15_02895 [Propionibacteriaceae bacterium]|nr:hypothetical protein [Propionibacteriaceae bacterium]
MHDITARKWKGHSTFYMDGRKLPGPSSLTTTDLTKPAVKEVANWVLDNWSMLAEQPLSSIPKMIEQKGLSAWDHARDRGKQCHLVMEGLVTGQPVATDDPTVLADAEAAARLLDGFNIKPFKSEQALIHTDLLYAGTADLIAEIPNVSDLPVILDFKFGKSIYPDHAIQASAYAHSTNMIIEHHHSGPKGGKQPSTYSLDAIPEINQREAFLLHAHDGVAQLFPIKTDGWVWECVQIFLDQYWEWKLRTDFYNRDKDTFNNPILDPLVPPQSGTIPPPF